MESRLKLWQIDSVSTSSFDRLSEEGGRNIHQLFDAPAEEVPCEISLLADGFR